MLNKKSAILLAFCAGSFALGAAASGTVTAITAQLRPDIKIVAYDATQSLQDENGHIIYPINYNGSIYVPLRSAARLLGGTVDWNEKTLTVTLHPASSSSSQDSGDSSTSSDSAGSSTTSTTSATSTTTSSSSDTGSSTSSSPQDVPSLTSAVDNLSDIVDALPTSSTNTSRYKTIKEQLDSLDGSCTSLETQYKAYLTDGTLKNSEYQTIYNQIEVQRYRLRSLADRLSVIFGLDD